MVSVRSPRTLGTIPVLIVVCLLCLPVHAKYSGGTGEPNDPYQIATAADLIALGETPADYDKHFILTADIDLDPNLPGRKVFDKAVIAPDTDPNDTWHDFQGTPFAGVFDGNAHKVLHLTVMGQENVGLFGYLSSGAEVKNTGLVYVNVVGSSGVGGLVGRSRNMSIVTNCYSTGMVIGESNVGGLVGASGGNVVNCRSTGLVSGTESVGGLVGSNVFSFPVAYGHVIECYSTGAVSGSWYVGGLAGGNNAIMKNCYSTGSVSGIGGYVGGLVGMNCGSNASVAYCYSTGAVSGSSNVGGLAGSDSGGFWAKTTVDCFWDVQTSGWTTSASGTGKTTAEMQTPKTFLEAGWDFVGETANGSEDIWKISEGTGYPRLSWEKYSGGTGEPNDPYQIATAADLILLGESPDDYGRHFILTADIDLDPNVPGRKVFDKAVIASDMNDSNWEFDGTPFAGVFDGNGHIISHLTVKGGSYVGLFGLLGSGAEIKGLGVVDVNMTGSGDDVGGLVGGNSGIVMRCYSTGAVSGDSDVGGLVGENDQGAVIHCYSTCTVRGVGGVWAGGVGGLVGGNSMSSVAYSYSTGAVSGTSCVGGLVGTNGFFSPQGSESGVVTQCYSTGAVSGTSYVGGLAGPGYSIYVTGCFWDTQASGQATSPSGVGKNTVEMQDPNTFMGAGWDFVGQADGPHDIWAEPVGGGYPILWWQQSPLPSLPGFSGGTGEPNDPYMISRPEELNSIGHNPRLMKCHFKLADDIDLAGVHFYTIGDSDHQYNGVFDGNAKTIKNLRNSLFGCVGGLIKDLRLLNPNCIGSPIGSNYGTIASCSVQGGRTSGDGGLVAWNEGNVIHCYSTCAVSGSGYGVGGLVGYNYRGTVTQCYSTGAVSGTGYSVGGLVGQNDAGTYTQCFWDTQTSGQVKSAGGMGKTTAEMKTAKTFLDTGWDFVGETANGTEDLWWILEGKDYPRLWWEAGDEGSP